MRVYIRQLSGKENTFDAEAFVFLADRVPNVLQLKFASGVVHNVVDVACFEVKKEE